MGIELLLVLVAVWLVAAPDGASLALSRGAAGAVRAGASAGRGAVRAHRAAHPRPAAGGRGGRGNWVSGRATTRTVPTLAALAPAPVAGGRGGRAAKGRGRAGRASANAATSAPAAAPTPVASAPVPSAIWPVLSAAVPAAAAGARTAVAAARERRAAGTDRTCRAVRALRRGAGVMAAAVAGARATGGGLRQRLRAGLDAARTRRAAQQDIPDVLDAPVSPEPAGDTPVDTAVDAPRSAEAGTPEQVEGNPAPAQNNAMTEERSVNTNTSTAAVGGTELATLADLRAEIGDVDGRVSEAAELLSVVTDWAGTLSERYSAAPFGTDGLNTAVVAAAEALAAIPNLDDLAELLATVVDETAKAEALGEVADELGATGDVNAFRAA